MKSKIHAKLQKQIKAAGGLVDRKIMRDFAEKFGLVYFGNMSSRGDEYELVRGVTLAPGHRDQHFIIGNYKGYDVSLLRRTVVIEHPHHEPRRYQWLLLQVDLRSQHLPHYLVTPSHGDKLFFDNAQIKLAHLQLLQPQIFPNANFAQRFRVFSETSGIDHLPNILSEAVMAAITHHFPTFDVEIFDDQVIIYCHQPRITQTILQEMLREGLWLATQLDERKSE